MTKKQKRMLVRIIISFVLFAALMVAEHTGALEGINTWILFVIYLVPYLVIGYDIVYKAVRNISHGQVFDENFLMMVATFGAFGVKEYSEAVAVMLFYQVGELFQGYAVGKSRQSISAMMDICPEYANIEVDGKLTQVDPDDVEVGSMIVVKPGERIPLDGIVLEGESFIDTAALTGESVPRKAAAGDEIISGCVNGSGTLKVQTTKEFDDSTVAKILELVENASSKKARVENFITRFAKYYTPVVSVPIVTPRDFEIIDMVRGSAIPIASIMCISVTEISLNSSVINAFSSIFKMSLKSFTKMELSVANVSILCTS